jgi:hypothetical protein
MLRDGATLGRLRKDAKREKHEIESSADLQG